MKNDLIQFTPNVQSTNILLSEMVNHSVQEGTCIPQFFALYTDFQTNGRGMGDNRWFSEKGKNLLVSFYFRPDIPASSQFLFNQYFATATRQFISRFANNVLIKWPNDIYINGKKLAGDLTIHSLAGNHIKHTIAGIGINLNQDWFPQEIPHPTSLFLETGRKFDVRHFLEDYQQFLIQQFDRIYRDPKVLQEEYLEHLFQFGEPHNYIIFGEQKRASIRGIDAFGRLQLEDGNGRTYTCGFKEVGFIMNNQ